VFYYPDYEDLILARQEETEIFEDDPDSPYFSYHTPEKVVCDECSDRGHCPEYQPGAPCAADR